MKPAYQIDSTNQIKIKATVNFTRLIESNKRVVVFEGSSRSGKTYAILQYLIARALDERLFITVARARLTWLKASVIKDFVEILETQFKSYDADRFNKAESTYTFENRSVISFIGLDVAQKIHGRKQDIVWLNEAIEVSYANYTQLMLRTTGKVILDYNPSSETHWIYEKICNRSDCDFFHSTYKDNLFLSPVVRGEIERLEPTRKNIENGTADETLWKIYGLGERCSPKGLVFPYVTIVSFFPRDEECSKVVYGLDFGYTNDPTTLVKVGLSNNELFLEELIYERGLTNVINPGKVEQESIEGRLRDLGVRLSSHIYADSAEPKSIQELKNAGFYNIEGAQKGPDSVANGIDIIKRYKVNITENSLNLIKEQKNYKWATSRDGVATNKPIDAFNHTWDATRYAVLSGIYEEDYFSRWAKVVGI